MLLLPEMKEEGRGAGFIRWLQLRAVCMGKYSGRVLRNTDDANRKFRAAASSQGHYSRPGEKESDHAGGSAEGQ
jgi:hypothetical protein